MKPKYQWTSADKTRWLAELARAIDEAQQIVWRLSILRGDNPRASEIYGELEAALDEVERLQRDGSRKASVELDQPWCDLIAGVPSCAAID